MAYGSRLLTPDIWSHDNDIITFRLLNGLPKLGSRKT